VIDLESAEEPYPANVNVSHNDEGRQQLLSSKEPNEEGLWKDLKAAERGGKRHAGTLS